MPDGNGNKRVTHQELIALMRDVRAWCDNQGEQLANLRTHFDGRFTEVTTSIENLRTIVNEQMHGFEGRLDVVEQSEAGRRRLANFRIALLRGSWKFTTLIVTAAGFLSGLIVKYGAPWDWRFGL